MQTQRDRLEVVKNIYNLYPQFTQLTDRRQQSSPVSFERRSGEERRDNPLRPDAKLSNDIGTIKHTFSAFISDKDEFIKQVDKYDNASKREPINFTNGEKLALTALSPITPIRRISSLPDNINDGNYLRAAGILGLMLINLPEDGRDLLAAGKQIGSKITSKIKFEPAYDYKNFQSRFSFFMGTFLEPLTNLNKKIGKKLYEMDKTIFDTKLGQKILELLKVEVEDFTKTGRIDVNEIPVFAYKLKGGPIRKLIGRSFLRVTVFGMLALSLLEVPAIYKAFSCQDNTENKLKNGFKQILKSSIYVMSMLSGIGLFGAWLSKKGPAGSLLGMGIGSIAGAFVSSNFNKLVNNREKTT